MAEVTTIAYRDGVLAADTLATWGDTRDGHVTKIAKRGRVLAAIAGNVSGGQAFLDWFNRGMKGPPPKSEAGDNQWFAYLFTPDDWMLLWGPRGWERCQAEMMTLGSGGDFARGAMSMGASPAEAVAVAIQHDTKSGGPITVLSVR